MRNIPHPIHSDFLYPTKYVCYLQYKSQNTISHVLKSKFVCANHENNLGDEGSLSACAVEQKHGVSRLTSVSCTATGGGDGRVFCKARSQSTRRECCVCSSYKRLLYTSGPGLIFTVSAQRPSFPVFYNRFPQNIASPCAPPFCFNL